MGNESINTGKFHIPSIIPVNNDLAFCVKNEYGRDCHSVLTPRRTSFSPRAPKLSFQAKFKSFLGEMSGRGRKVPKNRLGRALQKNQKQKVGQVNESGELVLGYVVDKESKRNKHESILDQSDMQAVLEYSSKANVENQRSVCFCDVFLCIAHFFRLLSRKILL